MPSYIPSSATDQTRFGAKSDHSLSRFSYGLRRYLPGVTPEALQCVPMRPDTPRLYPLHRRQSPGVTTASHRSGTAKPRCYTVANMNFNEVSVELITDMSFALQSTELLSPS